MAQVKKRRGGSLFGSRFISRAAKTGLSLLRNQMATLATQATTNVNFSVPRDQVFPCDLLFSSLPQD